MTESDIDTLATLLWHASVYRHIGGLPEASSEVGAWLRRCLAGPRADEPPQRWINHVMRLRATGEPIGLLQATLHDGIAEVAFLLAPAYWGQGLATEGLARLHEALDQRQPGMACWATVLPGNERSRRLLARSGYARVALPTRLRLMTYDDGDWVFLRGGPQAPGEGA